MCQTVKTHQRQGHQLGALHHPRLLPGASPDTQTTGGVNRDPVYRGRRGQICTAL